MKSAARDKFTLDWEYLDEMRTSASWAVILECQILEVYYQLHEENSKTWLCEWDL